MGLQNTIPCQVTKSHHEGALDIWVHPEVVYLQELPFTSTFSFTDEGVTAHRSLTKAQKPFRKIKRNHMGALHSSINGKKMFDYTNNSQDKNWYHINLQHCQGYI